jgi:hypothetical protein
MLFKKTEALSPATAAIARFSDARERLEFRHVAASAELRQLEGSLSQAALDELLEGSTTAADTRKRIGELRLEIEGLELARRPLEGKLLDAMRTKNHEDATNLRAQARATQRELDAHLAQRAEKYKAFSDFCGADFDERTEISMNRETAEAAVYRGEQPIIRISRARQMYAQIQGLLQQADRVERAPVSLPDLPVSNVVELQKAS